MARGFRGMKDDFMEIINHIIGLYCCSVAHDDNSEGLFLPLPQPTVGDLSCLEASGEFSATDTEVSDAAAMEGATCSASTCTAPVDDGTGFSLPQAEYVVIDEGLDPGFAAVGNTHCPTFQGKENFWRGYQASFNIKLYENDSESLPSSQIVKDNQSIDQNILERNLSYRSLNYMGSNALEEEQGTSKERSFDSASDIEDYYFYSQKEGEDVSIQKHILVEDHMASISLSEGLQQLRKRTNKNEEEIRDFHEIDGFEYVIV